MLFGPEDIDIQYHSLRLQIQLPMQVWKKRKDHEANYISLSLRKKHKSHVQEKPMQLHFLVSQWRAQSSPLIFTLTFSHAIVTLSKLQSHPWIPNLQQRSFRSFGGNHPEHAPQLGSCHTTYTGTGLRHMTRIVSFLISCLSTAPLCGNGKKNWCQKKKETVPPYKEGLRILQYLQYYHILQASNGSHLSRTLPSLENSHDFKFSQCKARSSIFSQPSQPALPTREVWRTKKNAKWLNGTNSTVHPYILSPRISIPFHIKYSTRLWLNGWTCEDSCH